MGDFLTEDAGRIKESDANVSSVGAVDAGKLIKLDPTGKLDPTLLPDGVGDDAISIEAGENLDAGDFVNIYDDGGTFKVRKADATVVGKEAMGFIKVAAANGVNVPVFFEGTNDQVTGQVPGYTWLSTTPGDTVSPAPQGTGNIVQTLGFATSATSINVEFGQPIELC